MASTSTRDSVGFEAHPVELGLEPGDCTPRSVVWADMDNDADQDLFLTCRVGPNHIYRNLGGWSCRTSPTPAASWWRLHAGLRPLLADINLDGYLDLFISNYASSLPLCANEFYLGDGAGHFSLTYWGLPQDLFSPTHRGNSSTSTTTTTDFYVIGKDYVTNTTSAPIPVSWIERRDRTGCGDGRHGPAWIDEDLDGRREVYITGLDEAFFMKDTGNCPLWTWRLSGMPPEPPRDGRSSGPTSTTTGTRISS